MESLHEMENDFVWTTASKNAFESIKRTLTNTVALKHPSTNSFMALTTDSSDVAIGAVLEEIDKDGKRFQLGFMSRKYTAAEVNYATFDKELLAIYLVINHSRHMLEGRKFCIYTDHKPLLAAFNKSENRSPRQTRFFFWISLDIRYLPGELNDVADAMS